MRLIPIFMFSFWVLFSAGGVKAQSYKQEKKEDLFVFIDGKKILCKNLEERFFKCADGDIETVVSFSSRLSNIPPKGFLITKDGNIKRVIFKGHSYKNKNIKGDMKVLEYSSLDKFLSSLSSFNSLIEYLSYDGPKNHELKKYLNHFKKYQKSIQDKINTSDFNVTVGDNKKVCRPLNESKSRSCEIRVCDSSDKKTKEYVVQKLDETILMGSVYLKTSETGKILEAKKVDLLSVDNLVTPFVDHRERNKKSRKDNFFYQGKIRDDNGSIVKNYMEIPKEFNGKEEMFSILTNGIYERYISEAFDACFDKSIIDIDKEIRLIKDQVSRSDLVQVVELVDKGLQSFLVSPKRLPCETINLSNVKVEKEAVDSFKKYQPDGPKTVITLKKAKKLFREQQNRADINWDYIEDGCDVRAHLMTRDFKEKGITSDKVWVNGNLSYRDSDGKKTQWNFHVAPIVYVKNWRGKIEKYVIDPSVSDRPLKVNEWLDTFNPSKKKVHETHYPLVTTSARFERFSIAFSNMIPLSPSHENERRTQKERQEIAEEFMLGTFDN